MKIWSLKNLEDFLTEYNINYSNWGTGAAKTLQHLLKELVKGETEFFIRDGKPVLLVHALSINVFYQDEVLKEEYQKFKDGRIRRRRMDCSVAEKLTPDELDDVFGSISRAMSEELQIKDIKDHQIKKITEFVRNRASGSYPGLKMDIHLYKYDVTLEYHQYHPYGYVENQSDKDTYFIWVPKKDLTRFHYPLEESILTFESKKKYKTKQSQVKKDLESFQSKIKDYDYILIDEGIYPIFEIKHDNYIGDYLCIYIIGFSKTLTTTLHGDKEFDIVVKKAIQKIKNITNSDPYKEWLDRVHSTINNNNYVMDISNLQKDDTAINIIIHQKGKEMPWRLPHTPS